VNRHIVLTVAYITTILFVLFVWPKILDQIAEKPKNPFIIYAYPAFYYVDYLQKDNMVAKPLIHIPGPMERFSLYDFRLHIGNNPCSPNIQFEYLIVVGDNRVTYLDKNYKQVERMVFY
jgi:hypothetical protein